MAWPYSFRQSGNRDYLLQPCGRQRAGVAAESERVDGLYCATIGRQGGQQAEPCKYIR